MHALLATMYANPHRDSHPLGIRKGPRKNIAAVVSKSSRQRSNRKDPTASLPSTTSNKKKSERSCPSQPEWPQGDPYADALLPKDALSALDDRRSKNRRPHQPAHCDHASRVDDDQGEQGEDMKPLSQCGAPARRRRPHASLKYRQHTAILVELAE